jgi:hypothetical protein
MTGRLATIGFLRAQGQRTSKLNRKAREFKRELGDNQVALRPDKSGGRGKMRMASVGVVSRGCHTPANHLAQAIGEALDPARAPGRVRTLADMGAEERAALERQYGAKISSEDHREEMIAMSSEHSIHRETDRAVQIAYRDRLFWVPKSMMSISPEGRILLNRWFAIQKRIIGVPLPTVIIRPFHQ